MDDGNIIADGNIAKIVSRKPAVDRRQTLPKALNAI